MTLLPAAAVIIAVAVIAGALTLAAFFWALRTGQFSAQHLREGASVIFDADEEGITTDQILKRPTHSHGRDRSTDTRDPFSR